MKRKFVDLTNYAFAAVSSYMYKQIKFLAPFRKNRVKVFLTKKVTNVEASHEIDSTIFVGYEITIPNHAPFLLFQRAQGMNIVNIVAAPNTEELERLMTAIAIIVKNNRINNKHLKINKNDKYAFIDKMYINDKTKHEIINAIKPFVEISFNYRHIGITKSSALIFEGEPGTSKSYNGEIIGSKIGRLLQIPFISTNVNEFVQKSNDNSDYSIMIDDANQSHFQRGGPYGQICADMLSKMDSKGLTRFFIFTTNNSFNTEVIDRAFFRPGRIESIIKFEKPDKKVKEQFLVDSFKKIIDSCNDESISNIIKDPHAISAIIEKGIEEEFTFANLVHYRNKILTNIVYGSIGNINNIAKESFDNVPAALETEISL